MGLFDILKKVFDATSTVASVSNAAGSVTSATRAFTGSAGVAGSPGMSSLQNIANTVSSALGGAGLSSQSVALSALPESLEELKAMPEASLSSDRAVAALAVAVLCNFERDPDETYRMMDFLRGPRPMNGMDKKFISDRLTGRMHIIRSFLRGTSPENNYEPSAPYAVEVIEDRNSRLEKDYVKFFLRSSGADSPRPIKLRRKPSTGQWFVWETPFLSDIRTPQANDAWA